MRSWSAPGCEAWTGTKSGCEGWQPAGGGQLGRILGVAGELVEGVLAQDGLQAHHVGLPGQEDGAVLAEPGQAAQQRRGVGGVTGLLRGPEGARLGQLALALLGEGFGHGGSYLRGGGLHGAAGVRDGRTAVVDRRSQLSAQGGDLLAQTVDGVQRSSAHGRGSGRGQQQGKRHGAH